MLETTAQQHDMTDTKYKHTELGPIPEHWEIGRLANYFTERREKVSDKEFAPLSVTKNGVLPQLENVAKSNDSENRKGVRKGDFVINSRSDRKGSSGVSDRDGSVSLINIVLTPRKSINTAYCNYLLKSQNFIEEFYRYGRGIVADLWTTRYSEMKLMKLAIPPLDEQEAMVAYLDEQTGKIDAAIEREQKMIDLLNERKQIIIQQAVTKGLNPNAPLKDSGIEWIGAIPESWKIMRLKRLVDFAGRIGFRGYGTEDLTDEENGAITLSPSNMQNGKMTYQKCAYLKWNKYYESPEIMVHDGDILFVKTGSTYGKAAIVKTLPKEATINPQLLILKNIKGDNRFIAHVLSTPFIKNQVERIVIGGTIPTISQEKIGNLRMIVPDKGEQTKIVEYIEDKTKPIDDAINAKYKLISMLRERKQIIVNEVVTGKIKVS